jgi:DNA modification methylase
MDMNSLILGDNLEMLKRLNSESVDLIYLDPPFFSNRNYEVIWGDAGEIRSFQDRWAGGISHYIDWLKERVREMHRILKPTGSIFLHCDWHADAHIRVLILEPIFGYEHFRNEITWKRTTGSNSSVHTAKQFGNATDTIFFFSKSKKWTFKQLYSFEDENYKTYVHENFTMTDEKGRKYRSADLSNPAPRPNLMYDYKDYKHPKNGWAISKEKMIQWDKEGRLLFPENKEGRIRRKVFLDELKGKPIQNIWDDISIVSGQSKEKIGYPTQKPEKLMERIIECASNEGDIVLDPFVGGGTTLAVADRLKRQWIGIDQSVQAVKVTEMRLIQQRDLFSQPFETQLLKYDYETLRFSNAYPTEMLKIECIKG